MSGTDNNLFEMTRPPASAPFQKRGLTPRLSAPNEMVTIHAGKGEGSPKFLVHRDFACHYCPVFKAAFSSKFVEGQTKTYHLEDTTEGAVRLLVHWFYTQALDVRRTNADGDCEQTYGESNMEDRWLSELWVLADRLLIPRLQNAAIRKLDEISSDENYVHTDLLSYIYKNTSIDSVIRSYLVHKCAAELNGAFYSDNPEQFPKQMLIELACLTANQREKMGNVDVDDFLVSED